MPIPYYHISKACHKSGFIKMPSFPIQTFIAIGYE